MNQSLANFIFNHRSNNTPITHTRIGDKHLNIHGGSFSIQSDNLPEFYKAYYHHIFVEHKKEYLTEKQSGLCIAIDFDFRYDYEITERQHGDEERDNLIQMVLDALKNVLVFENGFKFKAFIMEKPNVNRLHEKNITKDGIHMLINIQMEHSLQELLREDILPIMSTILGNLPITNSWDTVFDETITKGTTNWQLFGSRKPDNEAYQLVSFKEIEYDINEDQFNITDYDANDFKLSADNFHELSVQNPNNPRLEMNPKVMMRYFEKTKKQTKPLQQSKEEKGAINTNSEEQNQQLHKLNYFVDNGFAEEVAKNKNHLDFTKIGYALNNDFDEAGLELYLKMAEKYSDDFTSKEEEYTKKYQTSLSKAKNNSSGTIYYIFKEYNIELFKELNLKYRIEFPEYCKFETLDKLIDTSSDTEYDIAYVLAKYVKNEYVCTNIKDKRFYKFDTHRWVEDTGYSLRNVISTGLHKLYFEKSIKLYDEIAKGIEDEKEREKTKRRHKSICDICNKLKKTNDKNNIFREAMEILFDGKFMEKVDMNPYLFAFDNCVFDLRTGQQVQGKKEDYILTTTGYNYDEDYDTALIEELQTLINSILPNQETQDYYFTALATGMSGLQIQHLFIATGGGGNGKSIMSSLNMDMLGNFGYKLPKTTLQSSIKEGPNPAIANLHKKRFVLAQEPEKDKKLCGATIKDITGDKDINARQLYSGDTKTKLNGTFLLECNNMPIIDEVGDAINRRLRAIPFKTSAIEDYEYDALSEEDKASGKYLIKNVYYITDEFRAKYKQAMFHILLKKFMAFHSKNNNLPSIPKECSVKTRDYLATSDDLFAWVAEFYERIPTELLGTAADVPIKISDMFERFKESDVFQNMSKQDKRAHNKSGFVQQIETNMFLRKNCKPKDTYYNGKRFKIPVLVGWRLIDEPDEE